MTKRNLILAAILLVLPTLVLGVVIVKNQFDTTNARTWRVKITGYDPRDLLYGHYLNFRFDWGSSPPRCEAGQDCCLCFNEQEGSRAPVISYKTCDWAAKQCTSRIPVTDKIYFSYETGALNPDMPQKYFVPEKAAPTLDALLRNRIDYQLAVDVGVTASGRHILGDLYVNGVEWRDYLRQHPEAEKTPPKPVR